MGSATTSPDVAVLTYDALGRLIKDIDARFEQVAFSLRSCNGDASWTLPMPARWVVNRSAIVRTIDVDPDYALRPEPAKTLADIDALAR